LLELSSNSYSNFGFGFVQGPNVSNSGVGALMYSIGAQTNPLTLPYTSVATLQLDASLVGVANEIALRLNGSSVALPSTSGIDSGTANFAANPLYIGGRGTGITIPFNGRFYSIITRFGATLTADQITNTETWVNGKTKAYA
jgi:hypothetical protein